jgi:RNA polymerase sigma factor (sigma-70 family)
MLNFEDLYIAYAPEVYRFACWLAGNSNDAEDITAETFVRAWMNLHTIRTETLKAYLFTIARNIYLESLRKRHDHAELGEEVVDPHPGVEKGMEHESELDFVRTVLRTLPEIDRSAFVMRVQYDLSYAEIARVLQLSENSAKVKIHRIRKKLFDAQLKRRQDE